MKYAVYVVILLQELSSCIEIVDDYRLNVTSSGPAVYGSVITFQAQLFLGTSSTPQDKKLFRYEWRSTVDMLTETQQADYNTSLYRCFDSYVDPDKYKMRVEVFDLQSKAIFKPVVHKDLDFVITSKLNGNLKHNQTVHRSHRAPNNTFSTNEPVHFFANLTDNFKYSPNFTYKWYVNDKLEETGKNETFEITVQKSGRYTVRLDVASTGIISDCKDFEYEKNLEGTFLSDVILKDPVSELILFGKTVISKGENITLHAEFNGSAPFLFCWKLVSQSSIEVKRSCKNVTEKAATEIHLPKRFLIEVGKYSLTIRLENDVSLFNSQHHITVYEGPVPHHTSRSAAIVVVPVVSALVAITLLLIGGTYYANYRKKQHHHIESADFEFHKSIQKTSSEGWFWSNFKDAFRSLLSGHNSDRSWERINSSGRSGNRHDEQNRQYGTMVSPVET